MNTDKLTENYLTYDWKERRKIVWHNKEIHSLKIGACFQVTKGVSYLSNFFATTHNKCLKMYIKKKETKKYNQTPFFELFNTTDLTTQDINELVRPRKIWVP